MKRFGYVGPPAAALAMIGSLVVGAAPAQAASCGTGLVSGNSAQGHRAFGSCSRYDRASEETRITADCIASFDRNTSWFHDFNLHYTGYCYGPARGAFLSSRG